jgi:hypothetical protein
MNRLCVDRHARAGENTAQLIVGIRYFMDSACSIEAIERKQADDHLKPREEA